MICKKQTSNRVYSSSAHGRMSTERKKNPRPLMQHLYSSGFSHQPQDMKARTLPLMTALQMGQWRRLAAQSPHTTRCPQGMKTMDTSLSMHTLQVLSSCSCLSSSSGLGSFTAGRKTTEQKKHCWRAEQPCVIYSFSTLSLSKWHKLFPADHTDVDLWPLSLMGVCVLTFPELEPCRVSEGSEEHKRSKTWWT